MKYVVEFSIFFAVHNSSVVVRKMLLNKVGGINESRKLIAAEDYNTWLKIAKLTDNFLYLPLPLGYYFKHDKNLSAKNMSIPKKYAISDFLHLLTYKQKSELNINLKYVSSRYNSINLYYKKALTELFFVLKKGSIRLKVRALIRIFILIIRRLNFFS